MRDLEAGKNQRLTQLLLGDPYTSALPTNHITSSAIDAEGRFIMFNVASGTPLLGTTNGYRFDASNNSLMQVAGTDNTPSTYASPASSMSSDGRFAVYEALDTTIPLIFGQSDANSTWDVFVRDFRDPRYPRVFFLKPANALASIDVNGRSTGTDKSRGGPISCDGRFVVFGSLASNLTTNVISSSLGVQHLFVRDFVSNKTLLLDADPNGVPFPNGAANPRFSGNTRYVFFSDTFQTTIYRADLWTTFAPSINVPGPKRSTGPVVEVVCTNCVNPSSDGAGILVAYQLRNGQLDEIWAANMQTGEKELVSASFTGDRANGSSSNPSVSYDGRFIVFESRASNLASNDLNGAADIFARDRWTMSTILLSANYADGRTGNGASSKPVLSPNGRVVAFQSFATDLVPGDYNNTRDIFVCSLGLEDNDGDGMDDGWERHFFGTLDRAGADDFDGDGMSDLLEFRLSLDPSLVDDQTRIIGLGKTNFYSSTFIANDVWWKAAPGRVYQLQIAARVSGATAWTNSGPGADIWRWHRMAEGPSVRQPRSASRAFLQGLAGSLKPHVQCECAFPVPHIPHDFGWPVQVGASAAEPVLEANTENFSFQAVPSYRHTPEKVQRLSSGSGASERAAAP